MADEPILELNTKTGSTKSHGLNLNDLVEAERLQAEGMSAAEINERYPGWEQASRELEESTAGVRAAMEAALEGPAEAMRETLRNLDLSRFAMSETLRSAAESAIKAQDFFANISQPDPILSLGPSPVDATYEVAREVRSLAEIAARSAETARLTAETTKASLDQTAALVAAVASLHETTRQGIAAGEARDASAARRENTLVRLTWAIVALTAVLLWADAEPWRTALAEWLSSFLRARN